MYVSLYLRPTQEWLQLIDIYFLAVDMIIFQSLPEEILKWVHVALCTRDFSAFYYFSFFV